MTRPSPETAFFLAGLELPGFYNSHPNSFQFFRHLPGQLFGETLHVDVNNGLPLGILGDARADHARNPHKPVVVAFFYLAGVGELVQRLGARLGARFGGCLRAGGRRTGRNHGADATH